MSVACRVPLPHRRPIPPSLPPSHKIGQAPTTRPAASNSVGQRLGHRASGLLAGRESDDGAQAGRAPRV